MGGPDPGPRPVHLYPLSNVGSLLALVSYPALVEPYVGMQAQARAWSAACLPFVLLTLAVDTFSGDSIPVHLLTREALQLYLLHLRPGGLLAVHISDRYLDLAPVVGRAAQDLGKQTLEVSTPDTTPAMPSPPPGCWSPATRNSSAGTCCSGPARRSRPGWGSGPGRMITATCSKGWISPWSFGGGTASGAPGCWSDCG